MKKIYVLLLALVVSGVVFAQYTSKQNAVNNIKETKKCIAPKVQNTNKDVMVTFFSEDFEGGDLAAAGWVTIDNDGDGNNWSFSCSGMTAHGGTCGLTSASWIDPNPVTPDNYAITPQIDLSSASATVFLEWYVNAQDQGWPSEYYEVKVSTTGTSVVDFTTTLHTETVQAGGPEVNDYWFRTVDLTAYSGQQIYLAFVHTNCTDMFRINIEDVSVYENTIIDAAITNIVAPNNSGGCTLTASENVTITITNYGGTAITGFDVSYSINGGTAVTETVGATINPAADYDYTFAQTGDFSAIDYYIINASVDLTGDSDGSNDNLGGTVTNGDAYIEVIVSTDNQGDQAWEIYNSTNVLIASHAHYQWDLVNDITTVCLLSDDCYTFYWFHGSLSGSNDVTVTYNGATVNTTTATADWTVFGIGGNCPPIDISLTALTFPAYAMPSTDIDIIGTVQNIGTDNITSFDVVYTINGGAPIGPYSATCNIATGQTYDFTHDVVFNNAVEATYLIEVTISNVNGGGETNLANNVLSKNLLITSTMIQRLVVFEEFSTEQCSNCPPVVTYLHNYMASEPNMLLMTHHSGFYDDFLTIPESENDMVELFNDGGSTYAPAGCADRYFFDDAGITGDTDPGPAFWCGNPYGGNAIAARVAEPAFTTVEICGTYSQTTHALDAEIFGDFVNDFTGTIGVSFWITENNIPESVSPGQAGATSAWTHYYAVRDAISDAWGDEITTPTTVGGSYIETYNFNVDASWAYNELYLVAFVNEIDAGDPNNREIHNAFTVKLSDIAVCQTGNNSIFLEDGIQMYPNPTTGILNLINVENSSIDIYNILGATVLTIKSANSIEQIDLSNYSNGTYIIKVKTENSVVTEKIVLEK